jgi:spore coat polysaccharide biosynthesis protein SpsF (cytidylyltransferase family)
MKATVIIQARMGATRLPGKVLKELSGKTVLEHVVERARKARYVEDVIVATTDKDGDRPIVEFAGDRGIKVFPGSEDDVLDRYCRAARFFGCKHVVRITADCPVIDPEIIDKVIDMYFSEKADYCSNVLKETFPDGEDVEVFSREALERAWEESELVSEREHVTPYMRKKESGFKVASLENKENLGNKRWTLDREEDYEFLKVLYDELYGKNPFFGMDEILDYLEKNPEKEAINSAITRNEGYLRSLREDRSLG